ncbi:MAG: GDP-mannose 4,6-dehydratase [Phycisphaeraceae bacterium]|nr:GDP-mannose 4,6-dehydratase [Phycisphaeraceae bacterium]MCW5753217.1 GDP-mannose 4,6-dehydratase [Phycisphaeraceae bacterium]
MSNDHAPSSRVSLVTGGAGFIGSHLVDALLVRGDHVTVIDDLSTGLRANLPGEHPRLRFIEADLGDALSALGKGEVFDEIYHLAAAVGVARVMADPIGSIETNVGLTASLLRFAARHGRESHGARTLIASSSEVYGKAAKSPFSELDDVVYGPTTVTRWSYACSKALDEHLALAWSAKHNLPTVIVRFFNTVGPRQVGEYGMVLPRFVRAALRGEDLQVYGDGRQSRCFADVRDVVGALPRLMATPACIGSVFNLGSDRSITIAELADLVISTLGSASRKRFVEYSAVYPEGFEDLQQRRPDLSRIRTAIGYEPRYALEQTIRDIAAQSTGIPL